MSTSEDSDRAAALRSLLRSSPPPVRYDVERGLARHRRLVADGTPVPEWASELPNPGRVKCFGKPAWWLAGALTIVAAVWLSLPSDVRPEPASRAAPAVHTAPAPRAAHARPKQGAAPMPVAPLAATAPTVQAVSGGSALRTREPLDHVSPASPDLPARHAAALDEQTTLAVASPSEEPVRDGTTAGSAQAVSAQISAQGALSEPVRPTRLPVSGPVSRREGVARTSGLATQPGVKVRSRVAAQSPRDAEEMRQLAQAEQLLAPEPVRALRIVREGHIAFRDGYFAQERRYIELLALFALGRHGEAHAHAEWFLRDYPDGPYRRRVELELLRHPPR